MEKAAPFRNGRRLVFDWNCVPPPLSKEGNLNLNLNWFSVTAPYKHKLREVKKEVVAVPEGLSHPQVVKPKCSTDRKSRRCLEEETEPMELLV